MTRTTLILICLFSCILSTLGQDKKDSPKEWLKRATEAQNMNDISRELRYRNKLAFYFWDNAQLTEAIKHLERSLVLNNQLGNKNGQNLTHNYLGILYSEVKNYNKSTKHFQATVVYARQKKDKPGEISALINMAQVYLAQQKFTKTIETTQLALTLSKELNNLENTRLCYGLLAESYQGLKNSEKSLYYFGEFSALDKHIKAQEIKRIQNQTQQEVQLAKQAQAQTAIALHDKEKQLQSAKDSLTLAEQLRREQQMFINLQEAQLNEKEAQLKLARLWRIVLISGISFLLFFVIALGYFLAKIRKQKQQIEQQHEKLSSQTKQIQASINYAETIQQAVLPLQESLPVFLETFILFLPKDVVSGDFYWHYNTPTHTYIACVDCTGHGVPGAFMSMIGIMLLNEIAADMHNINPAQILETLDKAVQEALKQELSDNTDGMDLILVAIPHEGKNKNILFAGAKRPLFYFNAENKSVKALKTTRRGIGGKKLNANPPAFENNHIKITPNDCLYLTSDGIIDQQNEERKRFGSQNLLNLLTNNGFKPISIQKESIHQALISHQGNQPQRDDITLIGIKYTG